MTRAHARLGAILDAPMASALAGARERFRQLHGPGEPRVVLWGAGPLGRLAAQGLRRAGVTPAAICDRDPGRWHQAFEGHEILPPRTALERFGRTAAFVPTVYGNRRLLAELCGLGVRTLPLALLAWQFPEAMLPHCAMDLPVQLHREAGQVSEALGLTLNDVDLTSRIARVLGKGGKQRLAPLSDTAVTAMRAYLGLRHAFEPEPREQAFFLGMRGRPLQRRQANRIVEALSLKAGLPSAVSPHVLRHSFASHMLQSGADMRAVQELLGHARLSTTQRYTHLNLAQLSRVYDKAHPRSTDEPDGEDNGGDA